MNNIGPHDPLHRRTWAWHALVAVVFGAGMIPTLWTKKAEHNLYYFQAKAFLQGRLAIEEGVKLGDIAHVNGQDFVVFPPFPAVLLMPFVWLVDGAFGNTAVIACALTILNVWLVRRILLLLDMDRSTAVWMAAAFFAGTAYWPSLQRSHAVWCFAHVVAVTCLLLAVHEALGRGRPVWTGLWLGLAVLSRQLSIYSLVFLTVCLWQQSGRDGTGRTARRLLLFAVPVAVLIALFMAFNQARFGHPLESGYAHLPLPTLLAERVSRYGLFHPAYFPFNFLYMFLQGFHVEFHPPDYLRIEGLDLFGTSLTFASPFVFVAFLARWKRPLSAAAWLSVGLTLLHALFYYSNGWGQVNGQRYTLDFLPVLLPLIALGTRQVPPMLWKGLIVYSILLNMIAQVGFQALRLN